MKDISELKIPTELKYAKDHEWVASAAPYRVGVSDFAQDQLGDLTYVELPEVGTEYKIGDEFGSLESIKSVSSLYLPLDGKVVAVNEILVDDPGLVNRDPYGDGWLIEIEPLNLDQFANLMDGQVYLEHLENNA